MNGTAVCATRVDEKAGEGGLRNHARAVTTAVAARHCARGRRRASKYIFVVFVFSPTIKALAAAVAAFCSAGLLTPSMSCPNVAIAAFRAPPDSSFSPPGSAAHGLTPRALLRTVEGPILGPSIS